MQNPITSPLSFSQQRVWFLEKLAPETSVYNIPLAIRLKGPLSVGALERSFAEIVRRHEILRTSFGEASGEPAQFVTSSSESRVELVDLTNLAIEEREREAARRVSDDANRTFDLEHGPLVNITLIRLADDHHVLLVNMHHLVSDLWSTGVLLHELNALYNAFIAGQPSPLRDLAIQYRDYARWQREYLQGDVLDEVLEYWKTQLHDAPRVLELPTDRPRPAIQTYSGSRESFFLPISLKSALEDLGKKEHVTLFMTLLAAFKVLISRYARLEDLVIGLPVAGRNSTETNELIGFFVNTLVLRTDLSGDPTFREFLKRVRSVCSGAYAHAEIPLEVLVETLKPERSLAYSPLFQVMFAYQNAPQSPLSLTNLVAFPFDIEIRTSMFDLGLFIWERPDGLLATLDYSTDLFDRSTAQRLLRHFHVLLEGVAANPDERISRLPLLSAEERRILLLDWNQTRSDYPLGACLHTLFEQQAERTPEARAVFCEGQQLTYRELNQKANQLAHRLRELGVTAETVVGICLERSLDLIVGLLGILKAGGAFLPLDPELPSARLKYIIDDSQLSLIISSTHHKSKLDAQQATTLCLDQVPSAPSLLTNPVSGSTVDQAAYVIYTSGSSGLPKGVVATHLGTLNRLAWMWERYPFREDDVCCAKTFLSFVDSIAEIFGPLLQGVPVIIITDQNVRDVEQLVRILDTYRITRIVVIPSLLREMLKVFSQVSAPRTRLRIVISSGEALGRDVAQQFLDIMGPDTLLLNLYGSSEVAGDVTAFEVKEARVRERVPIGRPIANTQIYIVDPALNPVPIGVPGELVVGGLNLVRGYWNRPDLTAGRFIPNPFGEGRLYRTGDSARWLPDGNIELLGRTDLQLKIRGFRIEPGEIECVLNQHPALDESVVCGRECGPGDQRLIAYVVKKPGSDSPVSEFRGYLKDRLPSYMIPSAFVLLDRLPRTPSGKIDRRALPESSAAEISDGAAPIDEIEARLSDIWCYVLGLSSIGVNDDYFELGGHSLLAVRLFAEINPAFNTKLPLGTLFRAPTVRSMAGIIRGSGVRGVSSAVVPVQRHGSKPPIFCIGPLTGEVLLFRRLALELGKEQPIYGLEPFGLGDRASTLLRVENIASYYIEQMKAAGEVRPYCLLGYSSGGLVALEMAQQFSASGYAVPAVVFIDVGYGPALKAAESFSNRIRRYRYHLREALQGPLGFGHLAMRLRHRYLRTVYKAASALKAPLPDIGDSIAEKQLLAAEQYRARPYGGRVYLFRSGAKVEFFPGGPQLGWEGILSNVVIYDIPGDHGTINVGSNLTLLAKILQSCLDPTRSS